MLSWQIAKFNMQFQRSIELTQSFISVGGGRSASQRTTELVARRGFQAQQPPADGQVKRATQLLLDRCPIGPGQGASLIDESTNPCRIGGNSLPFAIWIFGR